MFHEPTAEKPQTKTDPTAHDRSTIRRRSRGGGRAPGFWRQSTAREAARLNVDVREVARGQVDGEALRRSDQRHRDWMRTQQRLEGDGEDNTEQSGRPHSRRGPTSRDSARDELPPLRRMGNRTITQRTDEDRERERHRNLADLRRLQERHNWRMERGVGGLGDRERSWSPEQDHDSWNVMGSTIQPDPSLPSASTSFASGADQNNTQIQQRPQSSHNGGPSNTVTSFEPIGVISPDERHVRMLGEQERHAREGRPYPTRQTVVRRRRTGTTPPRPQYIDMSRRAVRLYPADSQTPQPPAPHNESAPTPPRSANGDSTEVECPTIDPIEFDAQAANDFSRDLARSRAERMRFIQELEEHMSSMEWEEPARALRLLRRLQDEYEEFLEEADHSLA